MHLDDDGTDLAEVLAHVDLFDGSREGLFAANVGDSFNNWAGRLARLYAEQSTSSAEAIAPIKEVLTRINWMFYINGNHDLWGQGGDVLAGVLANSALVQQVKQGTPAAQYAEWPEPEDLCRAWFPGQVHVVGGLWRRQKGAARR